MMAALRLQTSFLKSTRSLLGVRHIATSKKNQDTGVASDAKVCKTVSTETKNWVSYGFDSYDKKSDRQVLHLTYFATVTLCLVCGSFVFMYKPDTNLYEWSQREAFIELRRREQKGLLPIDPNLIDPAQVCLPSDEELGDTDIII